MLEENEVNCVFPFFQQCNDKRQNYKDDLSGVTKSDLHSRLNGGMRTSMGVPSSFSILKVLDESNASIDRCFFHLTPTCGRWVPRVKRETNTEKPDALVIGAVLVRRRLCLALFPTCPKD
jgi:hypothetical protein